MIRPISCRFDCDISDDCICLRCDSPKPFLYRNNESKGRFLSKTCDARFSPEESCFCPVKLYYIYREFMMDFFSMDINILLKYVSSLKFSKHKAHVIFLHLNPNVYLGLFLHKISQVLKDLYNISISHCQISNHCKTAVICINSFADLHPYEKGMVFTSDEIRIKIRSVKTYI